jgi:hypothetical protein
MRVARGKLKFDEPPSGLIPATIAIASDSVDLPLPFSPTRYVTPGYRSSSPARRASTIGRSHG